jgi:hypothetical protein
VELAGVIISISISILEMASSDIAVLMRPWSMTSVHRGDCNGRCCHCGDFIAVLSLGSFHCGVRLPRLHSGSAAAVDFTVYSEFNNRYLYIVFTFACLLCPSLHTTKWLRHHRYRAARRMRQRQRLLLPCLLLRPCAAFLRLRSVPLLCERCLTPHRRVSSKG